MVASYAVLNLQEQKDSKTLRLWKFYSTKEKALQAYKGQLKWGNEKAQMVELYQPNVENSRYATPTTMEDFKEASELWENQSDKAKNIVEVFERVKSRQYRDRKGTSSRQGAKSIYHHAISSTASVFKMRLPLIEAIIKSNPLK